MEKRDILTENDVKYMVDTFYGKVNEDELLSPVFNDFAEVDWPHHLPKMYMFWNFIILGISGYTGRPFDAHMQLPISQEHFGRWLELFKSNIDEKFAGPNADMAKDKAQNIAGVFQYKLGILKK